MLPFSWKLREDIEFWQRLIPTHICIHIYINYTYTIIYIYTLYLSSWCRITPNFLLLNDIVLGKVRVYSLSTPGWVYVYIYIYTYICILYVYTCAYIYNILYYIIFYYIILYYIILYYIILYYILYYYIILYYIIYIMLTVISLKCNAETKP
jgi:hypothetical protein